GGGGRFDEPDSYSCRWVSVHDCLLRQSCLPVFRNGWRGGKMRRRIGLRPSENRFNPPSA
ncbi:hypothetical protein ACI43T_10490, partial [Neisseria oralis]